MTNILQRLSDICIENIERIAKDFDDLGNRLNKEPENEKDWVDLKKSIHNVEHFLTELNEKLNYVDKFIQVMEDYRHSFQEDYWRQFWWLRSQPQEIKIRASDGSRILQNYEERFTSKLDQEKDKFARDTLDIQKQLERVKKFNEYLP